MLELLVCSLLNILPDYLFRRYVQGKQLGKEITFYSVWFELRWGITLCIMLTIGLITGAWLWLRYAPVGALEIHIEANLPTMLLAGFIVGAGTRLGKGCTSGHGVCGIGRVSPRSLTATVVFMSVAGVTVFVTRHLLGGAA